MIPVNVNSDSGMLNTVSGKEGRSVQVEPEWAFTLVRKWCSRWTGIGVHDRPEYAAQFSWPTTTILTSNHSLTEINWPKIGILQAVGYRVGDKGLFKNERQKILNEVYKNQLPLVESQSYMDEWGSPKSSQRLYKIAYTIAALVRNAKRKTRADMRCAISEWESDLSWLRDKYYVDMMWDWPST